RFTVHDTRCRRFNRPCLRCFNRTFAINRLTERIDDTSQKFLTDWYLHDSSCAAYFIAFFNICKWAKDNDTDVRFFKVLGHPHDTVGELYKLTSHGIIQSVSPGDTVTDFDHRSDIGNFNNRIERFDLFFDQCTDFFSFNAHTISPLSSIVRRNDTSLDALEFSTETTVYNRVAHSDFHTAEHRRIDHIFKNDLLLAKTFSSGRLELFQFIIG